MLTAKGTGAAKNATALTIPNVSVQAGERIFVLLALDGDVTITNPLVSSVEWNGLPLTLDEYSAWNYRIGPAIYSAVVQEAGSGSVVVTANVAQGLACAVYAAPDPGPVIAKGHANGEGAGKTADARTGQVTTGGAALLIGLIAIEGPSGDQLGAWSVLSAGSRIGTSGGNAAANLTLNTAHTEASQGGTYEGLLSGITSRLWSGILVGYGV